MKKNKERKWIAVDIETSESAPENSQDSYALGVTCAATMASDEPEPRLWFGALGKDGRYAEKMTALQVSVLAEELVASALDGYSVIGINSLGFDLRVLAEECQDLVVYDNLRDLAMAHYDPAFQMLAERGFMIGMKALGIGLRLTEQKTADMDGQKAVEMWATGSRADQDRVLEYVAQDARTTLAIAEAIESGGAIVWQTKRGRLSNHRLVNGLLTMKECLEVPLPDTSWMDNPRPRERFAGWAQGE